MLIVCPNCATSYQVEPASLSPTGRSVRCARCKDVWFASAAAEEVTPAAEPALAGAEPGDAASGSAQTTSLGGSDPAASGTDADWPDPDAVAAGGGADAETSLDEAPPLVPDPPADDLGDEEVVEDRALAEDIETFAARRRRRDQYRQRLNVKPSLPALILVLLVVNAALLAWRVEVVRALPQTASLFATIGLPVNLRGLEFSDIKVAREQHDGMPVLVVDGVIVSVAATPVEVPRLRLAIRNETGGEVYAWTALPTRSILGPGEQLPFRSRLASPPAEGRDVAVRFHNRSDAAAAAR